MSIYLISHGFSCAASLLRAASSTHQGARCPTSGLLPDRGCVVTEEEEEYDPAPEGGWARCEHHDEQLRPADGAPPRPFRRVATTGASQDALCTLVPLFR
eukprot:4876834-Pyramimonas_sp.AAC.1